MCCSWLWGFCSLQGCRDSLCRRLWESPSLSCFASSPSALRGTPPSPGQTTLPGLPCVGEWATLLCSRETCPCNSSVSYMRLLAYLLCSRFHEAGVRSNGCLMSGKPCDLQFAGRSLTWWRIFPREGRLENCHGMSAAKHLIYKMEGM